MSIPSLDDIRVTGQPVPTATLLKLAELHGCTHRRTNGSHIVIAHREFSDLTECIVTNSTDLRYQKKLVNLFEKIEERRQDALIRQFEQAARDMRDMLGRKVPADLEYRLTDKGNIVLTDRAYPQVGLTYPQAEAHLTENKVRQLTDLKRQYAVIVARLATEHDVNSPTFDNGAFDGRLTHAIYDHMDEERLPAYEEGDEADHPFINIYDYIGRVQEIDLEHQLRKEEALARPFITQTLITSQSRRGERHNHVYYHGENGGKLSFVFATHSNRRATYDGQTSRITLPELERLETIVAGISQRRDQRKLAA